MAERSLIFPAQEFKTRAERLQEQMQSRISKKQPVVSSLYKKSILSNVTLKKGGIPKPTFNKSTTVKEPNALANAAIEPPKARPY